jgi:hypothetical protein
MSGRKNDPLPKDNLDLIVENKKNISEEVESRVETLNGDIIFTRNDPTIEPVELTLYASHERGGDLLTGLWGHKPDACSYHQPQACIQVLHLTEEATCCNRLYKRLSWAPSAGIRAQAYGL